MDQDDDRLKAGPKPDDAAVLVVEDDRDLNELICDSLASEYRIYTAFDGADGLRQVVEHRPDLVLTDMEMPKMAGDELVHEIRRLPDLAGIPIVVLTAREDAELRIRLLQEGALDYLSKPITADEVLARARNFISLKQDRDRMQSQYKRVLTRCDRLRAFVAQELRPPARAMRARLNWLDQLLQRETGTDPQLGARIQACLRHSKRLEGMVEQLIRDARVSLEHEG